MAEIKEIIKEVEMPEGVQAIFETYALSVKGPKGDVKKRLASKRVDINIDENKITIKGKDTSKKDKKMVHTFAAHIKNMVKGAAEGFVYKLKVCSGHFPMNVSLSGDTLSVKNLFGEKTPRVLKIKEGANVKVEGDVITVESADKESAGQVAADIEQLTRRIGFDRRIFQDGIYITEKAGKDIK